MTPERWQRTKEIVADALETSAEKRTAFVAQACADDQDLQREVDSMLAHADDETRFGLCLDDLSRAHETAVDSRLGQLAGQYRITREIGRGGMGTVYLGERADEQYRKEVAIKILKRGTDTEEVLRRFQTERQILARLEQPNIACLLDAGTTDDGLPYFVMEHVEGVPITDFCEARRLTIRERIRLFLRVCDAIQFAHRNLIVHRDLKPGNILVTAEGEPKLLDFGIAKLLAPEGGTVQITLEDRQRLTPGYASPEQVRGEPITTASDVYSLGALLHELLAGQTPHRFSTPNPSPTELLRVIAEQEPPRASAVAETRETQRGLRGDIDNILLKALRKEPERRYSGVTAFADDLRRYLEGRPVRARPATLGYRASRFVQRNKPGVAAGVILLAMLLGGIAATSVQKARAEKRFNEVRKLANAVLFDYHDAIASLPGSTAVRERLIKDALDYLDNLSRQAARDTGLLREVAAAYQKAGQIQGNSYYSNLGDTEGAMKSYRASLKIRQDLLAAAPHDPELQQETAASHEGVGDIHYAIGDLRAGLEGYERALEIRQGLTRGRPADLRHALALAQLYSRLGDIRGLEGYANLGDTAGALANHRKAYQILEPLAAAHPQDQDSQSTFANAVASSSMLALTTGDVEEALRTARRAVAHAEQLAAADENNQNSRIFLLKAKGILRYAQVDNNQLAEAIEGSKSVISDLQEMIVTDPKNNSFRRDLSVTHNALGKDLLSAGDGAGAIENHRSALAICESALAAEPNSEDSKSDVAFTLQRLGQAQAAQGESAAALENFRRALAMREPTTNADPSNARAQEDVLTLRVDIGKTLVKGGDFSEAIEAFRKAIPPAEALSKRDPTHARHQARLALTYSDLGQAHLGLARSGGRDGTKTVDDGRQAGEHFARSLALWQELRDRNALVPANEPRLKEAELGLAECDAAKL